MSQMSSLSGNEKQTHKKLYEIKHPVRLKEFAFQGYSTMQELKKLYRKLKSFLFKDTVLEGT